MLKRVVAFCVIAGSGVVPAPGDVVYFKNGDRLSGELERMVDGRLTFVSDVAGQVVVDVNSVLTFSSEQPAEVHLGDGRLLHRQIETAEPNHVAIVGAGVVSLGQVASINPPLKAPPRWEGDISAGYTSTHGNTRTDSISGSMNLNKRTEKDRRQLGADFARGRQEDPKTGRKNKTEDWWRLKAKYGYFFTKKFYGYLDGRYETDDIALLKRRVILGAGGGYQWIESEDLNFSTEAGGAWLHERFDGGTGVNEEVSLQFGYNFDKKLAKNVTFVNHMTYYPSTGSFSDYFLTSTAEVRAQINDKMFTNFKAILNYDDTPARGKHKTDIKYIWGIGWSFK